MAKIANLEVRMKRLSAFTKNGELDIVSVVMEVLEDKKMLFFELVKQPDEKAWFINQVKALWGEAEAVCTKYEAKQLLKEIKEFSPNARNRKVLLRDVIAAYVAFHRNEAEDKLDEIVKQLRKRISTPEMMSPFFTSEGLIAARPTEWPVPQGNYLSAEQAPYLKSLVELAKLKGMKEDALLKAWSDMLAMKSEQQPEPFGWELGLGHALHCLFFPLSYHEAKQHYCAYLSFVHEK